MCGRRFQMVVFPLLNNKQTYSSKTITLECVHFAFRLSYAVIKETNHRIYYGDYFVIRRIMFIFVAKIAENESIYTSTERVANF